MEVAGRLDIIDLCKASKMKKVSLFLLYKKINIRVNVEQRMAKIVEKELEEEFKKKLT